MQKIRIAIIAAEESGDLLGADLISELRKKIKNNISIFGIGGSHLEKEGLESFCNPEKISLMGVFSVLKNFFQLYWLIKKISRLIAYKNPDCLIIIDSPEFTHRVAYQVKRINSKIPIIKYVAPSVWAWRPKRAKIMRNFVDHVLLILPFELDYMKKLKGPPATYVGHRLFSYPPLLKAVNKRNKILNNIKKNPVLIVLPGSRLFEIKNLMPIFEKAINEIKEILPDIEIILPTLPRIEFSIRKIVENWKIKPKILSKETDKWISFSKASVALAASGTVSLELALCQIPMILSYKMDFLSKIFILPKIKTWSAALPNLITNQPIVPEYFNEFVVSGMLSRQVMHHLSSDLIRKAQVEGFKRMISIMKTEQPSGKIAAKVILSFIHNKKIYLSNNDDL